MQVSRGLRRRARLGQLVRAGIVSEQGAGLQVDLDAFARAAREASPERHRPDLEDATPEQAAVLRNFVHEDGRIRELPARAAKREQVLEYVAARFEPGREYTEKAVNGVLAELYDDYVTLRRLPRRRAPAHAQSRRLPPRLLAAPRLLH